MTIEEYLKKSAEEIENTIPKGDNCDGNIYLAGKVDAYREILSKLPEMEHEVTMREVMTFCRKRHEHIDSPKCRGCSLWSTEDDCCLVYQPYWIPVDEIEKRMKEARK